ncbi:chemotaxis protein CheW [bacterium]|nr:chemotaxis protein CheW [bacterium]
MLKKSNRKTSKKKNKVDKIVPGSSDQNTEDTIENKRIHRKLSAQKKKEILQSRSKELADELFEQSNDAEYFEVVEFILSFEKYAIESLFVSEVTPLKDFTPLPCTPSFVLGITNIRGKIVSVIDIKKFFNLPEKGLTNLNRVIVVETPEMELGILADSIIGVRLISRNDIQPSLPTLTDIGSEFIRGVTEDRMIILDIEKILCYPKIIVHQEIDT